jgi:uncharacterized delta-60 repeat protein
LIKKLLCSLVLILLPFKAILLAQQGKIDKTFNTLDNGLNGDGFNNTVRTLSLQIDNNLIVGGDYLSLNGISVSYLTRLKPDGTIDESFEKGNGFNGKIYASHVQSDGKIIVGGSFTMYNGVSAGRLTRLNTDGTYDTSFNTSIGAATGIIYDIAMQTDGKIIIVGSFTKYNNNIVNRIARILPDGSFDNSFLTGSGSPLNITSVRVLPNNKILIAGNFATFNGIAVNKIARLNTDGTIDSSFNIGTGFNDNVNAIEVQSDGKIILGGNFTTYNEVTANRIIRLNEDGTQDNTFQSGTGINSGAVQTIKIDSSGNIMVGGSFTGNYNSIDVNRVFFLNSNGIMNTDFDLGSGPASASVLALANDTEGSWYIGGSFSVFDGLNQGRLAKVNSTGEHDIAYLSAGVGFDNSVLDILPLQNKKAIVVGNFNKFNGNPASKIVRLLEDGSSDITFNTEKAGANNLVKTAVLQLDDKIILGGNFTKYNDVSCNRIVRILSDGSIDNTFNIGTGFNSQVYAMAMQSDGKIIAAGNFINYNGSAAGRIVRLLQDGSKDISFNVGVGFDAIVEAVLIQPDGKILLGGRFNTFNGNAFSKLIRLNSDGSIDSSFNIGLGFDKNIYAIALQSDQKIILGGSFSTFKGISQKRILRLNLNGSLDTTFDSGTGFSNGDVRSILVQPDDRILVGGTFSGTYKSNPSLRLIRLQKTGNYDPSFSAPLNNKLFSMSFTSDYRLLIGGNFNSVSESSKHRIARLKLCLESTTWDGISWSNGFPSGGKEVVFRDNYTDLQTSDVCSCTIEEGKTVTLLSDNTLGIEFSYLGLGTLVLENGASLYQSDDDMINTGTIYLKRKTNPLLRLDLTYWSSPVTRTPAFTLHDLSPKTLIDKYYKYDSLKGWDVIFNGEEEMKKGVGYSIRAPQYYDTVIPAVYDAVFMGVPNNGPVSVSLDTAEKWSLIGNPYPSAVHADRFIIDNQANLYGTLYFWTHNSSPSAASGSTVFSYNSDDFAVYNLTGSVNVSRGALSLGNKNMPLGYIAAGQSFLVKSKTALNADFRNSMRVSGHNSQFFKIIKDESSNIEKHRVWLNLTNSQNVFKQILIGYVTGATNSWDDNFDGISLEGNKTIDFYSVIEGKKLTVQGRQLPFDNSDIVSLGYKSTTAGDFSISIDYADGDLSTQNIYLEDKTTNTMHDLRISNYTFTTAIGTFNDRFVLRFTDKTLGTKDFETLDQNVFVSVKDKVIKIASTEENLKEVILFDVSGKELYNNNKIRTTNLILSNLQSSDQVLLVTIILENGHVINKKIIFF